MKVYFTNSFLECCYYVRCLLPLREGGWDGDRTSVLGTRIPPEVQAKAVLDADIIVFHRPNDWRSLEIAKELRKQGKKIVMDNDDTYKGIEHMKHSRIFEKIDGAIDKFGEFADMVTCSTEFLAEEYRKLNPNVVVLPNCVDPEDWPDQDEILKNDGEKVRIGIVGSVALNGDFEGFIPALKELSGRDDVQLVLFALPPKNDDTKDLVQKLYKDDYAFWESLNIEWQPFVMMEDYIETLNSLALDLMVVPRRDDYFNRCKSNIKFLEASMLEIPVIAQGFKDGKSPYQVDPEDSEFMKIVADNNDWMPAIEFLIQNKNMRQAMGRRAREYVLGKYQISQNINKWEKAYENLNNL